MNNPETFKVGSHNSKRFYKTLIAQMVSGQYDLPIEAVNENDPRLQGTLSLLPFLAYDSSSRKQMYSSHIGSCLTLLHGDERIISSGTDTDFGRYVFNVKAPCDMTVISAFDLYPRDARHPQRKNPYRVVLYRENDTGRIGVLEFLPYACRHSHFGHPMHETPAAGLLSPGTSIPADTALSNPPSIGENGEYKFSINFNTAYMSLPATSEDGVVISESACRRLATKRYETRTIGWGSTTMALPIYGKGKLFPDIGEPVRGDGVLMALRPLDDDMIIANQSEAALHEIDDNGDQLVYVLPNNQTTELAAENKRITGVGRVVDVRTYYNGNPSNVTMSETTPELDQQPMEYERYRREFCSKLLDSYFKLKRQANTTKLALTDKADLLITSALASMHHDPKYRTHNRGRDGGAKEEIRRLRRKNPMDIWEVTITVEYTVIPTIGFKLTDLHGGGIATLVRDSQRNLL